MVIADGRLYWIADAYTTTDRMPYSQPNGDLNYLRNSVKVVVDAYDGTMDFYVFDPTDPLLRTYERIFPGMFKPSSEMPAGHPRSRALPAGLLPHAGPDCSRPTT